MKFLNDSVRKEFHLLPVERQQMLADTDMRFQSRGLELNILHVDIIDNQTAEISLSICPIFRCAINDNPG